MSTRDERLQHEGLAADYALWLLASRQLAEGVLPCEVCSTLTAGFCEACEFYFPKPPVAICQTCDTEARLCRRCSATGCSWQTAHRWAEAKYGMGHFIYQTLSSEGDVVRVPGPGAYPAPSSAPPGYLLLRDAPVQLPDGSMVTSTTEPEPGYAGTHGTRVGEPEPEDMAQPLLGSLPGEEPNAADRRPLFSFNPVSASYEWLAPGVEARMEPEDDAPPEEPSRSYYYVTDDDGNMVRLPFPEPGDDAGWHALLRAVRDDDPFDM